MPEPITLTIILGLVTGLLAGSLKDIADKIGFNAPTMIISAIVIFGGIVLWKYWGK